MSRILDNAVIPASTTIHSQPIDTGDGNTLDYAVSPIVCGGGNPPTVSVELSSDLITWTPGSSRITTTAAPYYEENEETGIAYRYARIVVVTGATSPSVVNVSAGRMPEPAARDIAAHVSPEAGVGGGLPQMRTRQAGRGA